MDNISVPEVNKLIIMFGVILYAIALLCLAKKFTLCFSWANISQILTNLGHRSAQHTVREWSDHKIRAIFKLSTPESPVNFIVLFFLHFGVICVIKDSS